MELQIYSDGKCNPKCIILLDNISSKKAIYNNYVKQLLLSDIFTKEEIISIYIEKTQKKSEYIDLLESKNNVKDIMENYPIEYVFSTSDTTYKALTKSNNKIVYGYSYDCHLNNKVKVIPFPSIYSLETNTSYLKKLELSIMCINSEFKLGSNIKFKETYVSYDQPELFKEILNKLHNYPVLAFDIEDYSLRHTECSLGSVSFSFNEEEFFAINFTHGLREKVMETNKEYNKLLKEFILNYKGKLVMHNANYDMRVCIYVLFMRNTLDMRGMQQGLHAFYKIFYCTRLLAYVVRNSIEKKDNSLKDLAFSKFGDYGILNKNLPKEEQVEQLILNYTTQDLLKYNGVDTCATMFIYNKYINRLPKSQQDTIKLFRGFLINNLEIELTGIPVDMATVDSNIEKCKTIQEESLTKLLDNNIIKKVTAHVQEKAYNTKLTEFKEKLDSTKRKDVESLLNTFEFNPANNSHVQVLANYALNVPISNTTSITFKRLSEEIGKSHKKLIAYLTDVKNTNGRVKYAQASQYPLLERAIFTICNNRVEASYHRTITTINKNIDKLSIEQFRDEIFNPKSTYCKTYLIYNVLGLPELETTKKGNPSVSSSIINDQINMSNDKEVKEVLNYLKDYISLGNMVNTFLPAFKKSVKAIDGSHRLYGNLSQNIPSGRLSSNNPNMQNIPSQGMLGKMAKSMVRCPDGYVLLHIDFDALESKAAALLSKDQEMMKPYLQGFDGHCLRAYWYFSEQMPDIDVNSVDSVESIKKKYPKLRAVSKGITFALQYFGTEYTLMRQFGFSKEEATAILHRYREMYGTFIDYMFEIMDKACQTGYVQLGFGLKVATPLLKGQSVSKGADHLKGAVAAQFRSAYNAATQWVCMLNSRASLEFMHRRMRSPYRYYIQQWGIIHDALYFCVKKDPKIIQWFNKNLVECICWQNLDCLKHDKLKISGSVEMSYPSWNEITPIPVNASVEEITKILEENNETSKP